MIRLRVRAVLGASAAVAIAPLRRARAQSAPDSTIRIGMLTDMSGPYRDVTGPTGVACARQAIAEFTTANPGIAVDMAVADHQNKPDIAVGVVREWFDRGGVGDRAEAGSRSPARLSLGALHRCARA